MVRPFAIVSSMRPKQWAKNVFALAPLLFAHRAGDGRAWLEALAAAALFCLASGAVYLFNDVADREADRHHPTKRRRPVASGELAVGTALATSAVAVLSVLVVAALWRPALGLVLASFVVLNLLYSFLLKHVPVVDVLVIAAGFILRVAGGAFAIEVPISGWILLCTFLLALYLGLGKRVHELAVEPTDGPRTRASLAGYHPRRSRLLFALTGVAAAAAFVAYSLSAKAVASFGTGDLVWTTPLVVVGLARFGRLAVDRRRQASPTEALLTDPVVLLAGFGWALAAMAVIYWL